MIYLLHHHKSQGKIKDKEHLNLRCLVQVGPEQNPLCAYCINACLPHDILCWLVTVATIN